MDNTTVNAHLSALTRELINACGGYIAAALECDVSSSQLERAANPQHSYTLKASTIWHLEQACGQAIVSTGLCNLSKSQYAQKLPSPVFLGIDLAKKAANFTAVIADAYDDGVISVFEHRNLTAHKVSVHASLSRVDYSLSKLGSGQ